MSNITLKNVRLSFPNLFKKAVFKGKEGKFEATFLIDKSDTKTKEQLDKAISHMLKEAGIKLKADKIALKDGDDSGTEGYDGNWTLKAGNNSRPTVVNRDRTPLAAEDGIIYAGCYVNAIVSPWLQDNDYGTRINFNLLGVQFVKDGESFGAGPIDVTADFEDLADDSDDL